jgi:hypothetical protein
MVLGLMSKANFIENLWSTCLGEETAWTSETVFCAAPDGLEDSRTLLPATWMGQDPKCFYGIPQNLHHTPGGFPEDNLKTSHYH